MHAQKSLWKISTVTAELKTNVLESSCVFKMLVYNSIMPQIITPEDSNTLLRYLFIFIILQFKIAQETKFMYITSLVKVKNTTNSVSNLEYQDVKCKHNTDIKKQNLHAALVQGR
jgi:hypothetical protein